MNKPLEVFTIGHSNHSIEHFLKLLNQHSINVIADVRSVPHSKFNPEFSQSELVKSLKELGIRYVFLGRELGARSSDPSHYQNGQVQYSRLRKSSEFQSGVARLKAGAFNYRIALLCAEKEPLECHRAILVSPSLDQKGFTIWHIHADGTLEQHSQAMDRLVALVGLSRDDMWKDVESLISEALGIQGERIAYKDEIPWQ